MRFFWFLFLISFCFSGVFFSIEDNFYVSNIDAKSFLVEKITELDAEINWTTGTIRVFTTVPYTSQKENIGKFYDEIQNSVNRELYLKLSRAIGLIRLSDPFLVKDYYQSYPDIRYELSSYLEKTIYYPMVKKEKGAYGIAELPLFGEKGIVNIFFKDIPRKEVTNYIDESKDLEYFDTLIIDMIVHKEFNPSIGLRIYDEDGTLLYGPETVNPEVFKKEGLCIYTKNLAYAFSSVRTGKRIFYTIPAKVKGQFNTDIVLFNADARRLFASKRSLKYINNCKVIIVKP